MVKVASSSGGLVTVEFKGVSEAIRAIYTKGKQINGEKDAKTLQASNFIQSEIQESIVGNRSEPKSVDTGNFANSIQIDKKKDMEYSVFTDVSYAKELEYGTIKMEPRSHFRNTVARNKEKVISIIKG